MSDLSQRQKNLRGILAMVIAMGCFVMNDTLVKLARQDFGTGQILVVRGVFALAILAVWLVASRNLRHLRELSRPAMMLRGVMEGVIATTFVIALGMMTLADITAIMLTAPLVITALAVVLFGEKVGWRRWTAVVAGFAGMLLVIRPGSGDIAPLPLVLSIVAVLGVGFRDATTRKFPAGIPSVVIALTSTLGTLAAGLAFVAVTGDWRPVTGELMLLTASAAFLVIGGNYAIIEACRDTELSVVSAFRYGVILWAVLIGVLVFGEWPEPVALIGIGLIVGSGLYTLHRERVRGAQR